MPTKSTGRKRGRPAHVPTALTRRKVSIAAGGGMLHQEIAIALGISRDTLAKYYERELSVVALERRMEALMGIHAAAKKGSAAAAKAYLAVAPQLAPPPVGVGDGIGVLPAAPVAAPAASPVAQPLGKKEAANVAARSAQAGTEWDGLLPAGPVQ